jgi:hypothetical protein
MPLIDTDKNGLRAGRHRQPGSAEVLLGRILLEHQHHGSHRQPLQDPRGICYLLF